MGKPVKKTTKKAAKGLSRKTPKKGDVYKMVVDVEATDVDGDNVTDLVVKHEVTKNDELFVSANVTWFGLEPEVMAKFEEVLAKSGVEDGTVETNKFGVVLKNWRKLTKALQAVNKFGKEVAEEELGEEPEVDEPEETVEA